MSQGIPAIANLEVFLNNIVEPIVFHLTKPIHTIGRSKDCDVTLPYQSVSRVQFTLVWRYNNGNPFYQLIDGDRNRRKPSFNGVFVNGHRVEEIWECLYHGDVITFPLVRIVYCLLDRDGEQTDSDKGTMGGTDE